MTPYPALVDLMPFYRSRKINPGVNSYWGPDSREALLDNQKTQPQDWIYHTKPVTYTVNSQGYRTDEFDSIDWNNSLVIFGCSNAFGFGVSDQDTISSQLSKMLNLPVINLGVPGSSIYFSYVNLVRLLAAGVRPRGVINCWTEYHRITEFKDNGQIALQGIWSNNKTLYYHWNQQESNSKTYALTLKQSIDLLCESLDIWHCDNSYFKSTAELFECDRLRWFDRARDLDHPGHITHKVTAVLLAQQWLRDY